MLDLWFQQDQIINPPLPTGMTLKKKCLKVLSPCVIENLTNFLDFKIRIRNDACIKSVTRPVQPGDKNKIHNWKKKKKKPCIAALT